MKQPILFVALLLALTAPAIAQQKEAPACTVRVMVLKYSGDSATDIQRDALSQNQSEWWDDNAKKFPGICLVTEKPAHYILGWTETWTSVGYTANVPVTTTHSGTVTTDSGRTGTYSGTSTTHEPRQQEWHHWWVEAHLFKVEDGQLQPAPLFEAKHHGRWMWSKPDKDAFEKSLKKVKDLTKTAKKP